MPYAQLSEVDTWYAEQGEGKPLVLLHPVPPTPAPSRWPTWPGWPSVTTPTASTGAVTVALLVAAARPDLVRKLVFSSGVYHHQGWLPGVLELDDEVEPVHLHSMHRAMPHAQLAIVPGTGHGLLADKPDLCNRMIIDVLDE